MKGVKRAYSDTVKRGTVIGSDPEPGERIRDNDSVTLTVSKGPEIVRGARTSRATRWTRPSSA